MTFYYSYNLIWKTSYKSCRFAIVNYYPENTFEKFEFNTVKKWVNEKCISPMGKAIVENLRPYSSFKNIQSHLALTDEMMELLENHPQFPIDGYIYISPYLNLLRKEGYTAQPEQITSIRSLAEATREVIRFVNSREDEEVLLLKKLIKTIEFKKEIITVINKILTPQGSVKNRATDVLAVIRIEQENAKSKLEKEFNKSLTRYRNLGYLADMQESVRHGRRVLAVKAEYKRKIKGVIHDISETGQTAYVEPNNALQLSNEIINLEQEERAEIYRILRQLTADLQPYLDHVLSYEELLGRIDFTRAKALVAKQLNAVVPQVVDEPIIDLKQAYHPILKLQNEKAGKETQPLTLFLHDTSRILVISGPNAGGKSVSLKTIGLLQLMIQSGMPIPVDEFSRVGIFKQIFSEIGDDQSIENELSTYSSKLKHMSYFLKNINDHTLFLIDEFGSGTDPSLGGAVAEAILRELNSKKAYGVITTHYLNLKTFASETDGVENAAMLFDENSLQPLYQLETGKPGSSYTFAIAQTSGLPEKVVNKAKQLGNKDQVELDDLLTDTQQSQSEMHIKQLELENRVRELERKEDELKKLKKKVKKERSNYQINKKDEELRIKTAVKKKFDDYVKKLSTVNNQQKAVDELRARMKNELDTTKDVLHDKIRKKKKSSSKRKKQNIEVGDRVQWILNEQSGEVLEIKNNKAEVAIGNLKTTIPLKDLMLLDDLGKPKRNIDSHSTKGHSTSRMEEFQFEIDLRGKRYEEAEALLHDFFDKAILNNSNFVRILHGKGSGVLRELTAKLAKEYKAKSIGHPHPEEGGDGITNVQF